MKKNKKLLYLSLALLLLFGTLSLNFYRVRADSGWDSSYDGGSWDSSSSWDSDYSGGGGGDGNPVVALIVIVIFVVIIIIASKKEKERRAKIIASITIPNFDANAFLKESYNTFIKVQNAWSEFNYDELQKLLSDELYNSYKSQLKALGLKKQKNIMTDFRLMANYINSFSESDTEYTIKTRMMVKFYDYVVDNDGKVVRGNKNRKLIINYELTWIKSKSSKANKCPNCNAPLDNVNSSTCPYCNSTIISSSHDFILAKKQAISQRME